MLEQKVSPSEVARSTGMHYSTILNWGHGRQKPPSVSGLESLAQLGMLDLDEAAITTTVPSFQGLHYFAMLVHVTGSLIWSNYRFAASFCSSDESYIRARHAQLSMYGIKTKISKIPLTKEKTGFYVSPKEGWSVIGRAMHAMGVPAVGEPRCFPDYLKAMIDAQPSSYSKEMKMLRQSASMFFEEGVSFHNDAPVGFLRLRECAARTQAQHYAEDVVSLFAAAIPKAEIDGGSIRVYKRKRNDNQGKQPGQYAPVILLRKQNWQNIAKHCQGILSRQYVEINV